MQDCSTLQRHCVLVCQYRSCSRNGAADVLSAFQAAVPAGVFAKGSDCMGQCAAGVTVRIVPEGTWYCRIKPEHVPTIVQQHLRDNQPVAALLHPRFHPYEDSPYEDKESSVLAAPASDNP
jgi:(2Fe-2S) ferredoxin